VLRVALKASLFPACDRTPKASSFDKGKLVEIIVLKIIFIKRLAKHTMMVQI